MSNKKQEIVVVDQVLPEGKWSFDGGVTAAFDNMLSRSIPQYDVMRQLTYDLACKYAKRNTAIIDLGCSRGEAMAQLVDHFGVANQFYGIEVSEPMLEAARERFQLMINAKVVDIRKMDIRHEYPPVMSSVTMSVLTLQFTPIEYRLRIMKNIYDHLLPGGAFILVEKVIGGSADIDANMVELYYKMKAAHGYTTEQIERKRLSLEGVLVPVTAKWNEELLAMSGFTQVDCFWRWCNFAGWIAIK